jgi:hypothetical protein
MTGCFSDRGFVARIGVSAANENAGAVLAARTVPGFALAFARSNAGLRLCRTSGGRALAGEVGACQVRAACDDEKS